MPEIKDSQSVVWSELGGELSASAVLSAADVGALPDSATASDVGALPDSTTASDIGALPDSATASDVNAVALAGDTMTGDLTVPNLTVTGSTRSGSVVVNAQSGTTYTLVLSDAGKLVTLDNGSAITLTVPPNSSVAFEVGATIALAQLGAGTVSVAEGSGVTVSSLDGNTDLSGQYATASLVKTATDSWLLVGALA